MLRGEVRACQCQWAACQREEVRGEVRVSVRCDASRAFHCITAKPNTRRSQTQEPMSSSLVCFAPGRGAGVSVPVGGMSASLLHHGEAKHVMDIREMTSCVLCSRLRAACQRVYCMEDREMYGIIRSVPGAVDPTDPEMPPPSSQTFEESPGQPTTHSSLAKQSFTTHSSLRKIGRLPACKVKSHTSTTRSKLCSAGSKVLTAQPRVVARPQPRVVLRPRSHRRRQRLPPLHRVSVCHTKVESIPGTNAGQWNH